MKAVRSLRLTATQWSGGANGQSVPMTVYWQRPDRLRIETPEDGLLKVVAFDGTTAWSTYPELAGFKTQILGEAEREALVAQADLLEGPTFDPVAKGHRVEFDGREKIGGGEAWRVRLTTAQGEVRRLWFDCETFLQVREERTQTLDGHAFTTVSILSDFRPAGGILFAHRTESRSRAPGDPPEGAGDPTVFSISTLEIDADLPDGLFSPPAAGPAPQPGVDSAPAATPR
jgi:outer membrane lipoprotein-sorting protein